MGFDWRTPGYLIREEIRRDKLRGRAGMKAWVFGKRLEKERGSELARCWKEIKDKLRKGKFIKMGNGKEKVLGEKENRFG